MSKKQCPHEEWEQSMVVSYCDAKDILVFHIPNGVHVKSHAGRAKLKRIGQKSGIPDLMVPKPTQKFHGLFIEMKRAIKSQCSTSKAQRNWIVKLNTLGYVAIICYGHEEAIAAIEKYLRDEFEVLS